MRIATTMSDTKLENELDDGFMNGDNNPPAASAVLFAAFPTKPPTLLPAFGSSKNHPSNPAPVPHLNRSRKLVVPSAFVFLNHPFFFATVPAAATIMYYYYTPTKKSFFLDFFSWFVSVYTHETNHGRQPTQEKPQGSTKRRLVDTRSQRRPRRSRARDDRRPNDRIL